MPGYLDTTPVSLLGKERTDICKFIDQLQKREGITTDASPEVIDGLIRQLETKVQEYNIAINKLNDHANAIDEIQWEDLKKKLTTSKTPYDLLRLMPADEKVKRLSEFVELNKAILSLDDKLNSIESGITEVFKMLSKYLPTEIILQFDDLRKVMMFDIRSLVENKPVRIQRRRVKGWRMPANTISVTRPGKWGNPFTGENAVKKFRECLHGPHMCYYYFDEIQASIQFDRFKWMSENIHLLKGKNLACYCSLDKECHADALLEFSNHD